MLNKRIVGLLAILIIGSMTYRFIREDNIRKNISDTIQEETYIPEEEITRDSLNEEELSNDNSEEDITDKSNNYNFSIFMNSEVLSDFNLDDDSLYDSIRDIPYKESSFGEYLESSVNNTEVYINDEDSESISFSISGIYNHEDRIRLEMQLSNTTGEIIIKQVFLTRESDYNTDKLTPEAFNELGIF